MWTHLSFPSVAIAERHQRLHRLRAPRRLGSPARVRDAAVAPTRRPAPQREIVLPEPQAAGRTAG